MEIELSPKVITYIKNAKKKDKQLARKIEKQVALFKENPKHPSLRLHKLTGQHKDRWSISITENIRIVYILLKEEGIEIAYLLAIGTHDQVYKK